MRWRSNLCEESGWKGHSSVWNVLSSADSGSSQRPGKLAGSEVVAQLWLVYYNEIMRVIAAG